MSLGSWQHREGQICVPEPSGDTEHVSLPEQARTHWQLLAISCVVSTRRDLATLHEPSVLVVHQKMSKKRISPATVYGSATTTGRYHVANGELKGGIALL